MMPRKRKMAPVSWSNGKNVEWILSDWYCPKCAERQMWQPSNYGAGDYYHECWVECASCGHHMCCVGEVMDEPSVKAPWWDTDNPLAASPQGDGAGE